MRRRPRSFTGFSGSVAFWVSCQRRDCSGSRLKASSRASYICSSVIFPEVFISEHHNGVNRIPAVRAKAELQYKWRVRLLANSDDPLGVLIRRKVCFPDLGVSRRERNHGGMPELADHRMIQLNIPEGQQ